jgi:hypothetical protein
MCYVGCYDKVYNMYCNADTEVQSANLTDRKENPAHLRLWCGIAYNIRQFNVYIKYMSLCMWLWNMSGIVESWKYKTYQSVEKWQGWTKKSRFTLAWPKFDVHSCVV